MAILQVRSMDDDLYGALSRRAIMENRSISQEVISIIKKYLAASQTLSASPDEAALRLAGSWSDGRSADKITNSIRKSRTASRFHGDL